MQKKNIFDNPQCKSFPTDYVCCPFDDILRDDDFNSVYAKSSKHIFSFANVQPTDTDKNPISLLPSTDECGLDIFRDKIFGGSDTALDDSPWVALIQYYRFRTDRYTFDCGGTLISRRYVLTAAHCVSGDILIKVGSPVSVRLGEYSLETEVDCMRDRRDCVENQYFDIGVEALIPHAGYSTGPFTKHHDIGLIRLIEDLDFTQFIRPICLTQPYIPQPQANASMYIAGFGRTLTSKLSNVKQKLQLPVFDHQKCTTQFKTNLSITLSKDQICAGGEYMRDTCSGDSGAALAQYRDNNWYAIGLVSFGIKCGLSNWPGVYTYVPNYVNWILDNMQI